jgi:serine/threonine protein kinase
MVADAFSVGATIRHMVTGVPPNMDVEDFIARRNHPLMKLSRSLGRRCALLLPSNGRKRRRRTKRYRSSADLPHDVRNLIHGLTHYDPRRRATVRSATRHPWLETSAGADDASPELEHGGPISYLKCAA